MRLNNLRVVPCRRRVVGRRGIDAIDACALVGPKGMGTVHRS
jgi:hypothetical protein